MNSFIPLPKIGLKGAVFAEFRTCGAPTCRCTRGMLHGPYFVRRWREAGRQRKGYVKSANLPGILIAIEATRVATPSAAAMRKETR